MDAVRFAVRRAKREQPAASVDARAICTAVRDFAIDYFNDVDEARDLLGEWGIRSSEDVGRIVMALVDTTLVTAGPDESVDHFARLFTLSELFDQH